MATAFHEVRFPLRLSLATSGGPIRRSEIVNLTNGRENRNRRWRDGRRSYDAGSGVRSLADLYEVVAFFEARGGEMHGFRFRDPLDHGSAAPGASVSAHDQVIGVGDGERFEFQLAKTYGDAGGESTREIAKPVAGTVTVSVNGAVLAQDAFACDPTTGVVRFEAQHIPASGAIVRAGFEFDVPVRFAIDRLDVNLSAFNAGRIPTIPLMEIKP
ncbi:TIGR02217 family protein [Rhizobiaceae bacterium n13]|uniref:TIGR02217 family protein n=1 Tax=Ferirhizobium litorale TaxID=2927786 RepID=A0AAE3QCJ0_9HYPH|nr:TIGR02217 family protein [Fererhizobium litorale]MDI7861258.1 TIGR02217 family protein [Fererhizobium litorale]MDI7921405.1 TIGR02217 family protein [Fererhizobium litorale]